LRRFLVLSVVAAALLGLAAACVVAQTVQNVELHGYMQNRLYMNPSASSRFVVDRVSLSAIGKMGDDGTAYAEVYFHPWLPTPAAEQFRTYIESAYVDLPLGAGRIRVGKGRMLNFGLTPSYPNRKTTQYGMVAETFTQDRIVGAQYVVKNGTMDFGATLYTDESLGTRSIGDFAGSGARVVRHVVDKDVPASISGKLAASAKIGWTKPQYQLHFSGAVGKLNQTDVTNTLNANPTAAAPYGFNVANTDRDHSKYGIDFVYNRGPFVAQAEYYKGTWSFMDVTGWQVLFGYQPKDKMRFYIRYSDLDSDYPATVGGVAVNLVNNQLAWDTQQLTIGIVRPIRKGVWVELNYERNGEDPTGGSSEVDNDLLFMELFTGF